MIDLWVFLHVVGVASFLLFHGVQIWALFAIPPAFPNRERMFDRAEQSRMAGTPMYASLGFLTLFGVISLVNWAFGNGHLLIAVLGAVALALVARQRWQLRGAPSA